MDKNTFQNKDTFQGDWNELKGKVKEKWGKLTDNDLTEIQGKRDQLLGKLQKRYGLAKEKAEEQLTEWEKSCSCSSKECCSKNENIHNKHEHKHTVKH